MNHLFQQSIKNKKQINWKQLQKFYIETFISSIDFYDNLALKKLNRSPRHILLLHENDLTTLFISELIGTLKSRGRTIISTIISYQDPLRKFPENTLQHGQGRIISTLTYSY